MYFDYERLINNQFNLFKYFYERQSASALANREIDKMKNKHFSNGLLNFFKSKMYFKNINLFEVFYVPQQETYKCYENPFQYIIYYR